MKSYDGLFIFKPRETPDTRKNQIGALENLIKKFEGSVKNKNEWGDKPLGYPLRKFREGYFLILDFQMNPARMAEFRNALGHQEALLNVMLTVQDPKSLKPSAERVRTPAAKTFR